MKNIVKFSLLMLLISAVVVSVIAVPTVLGQANSSGIRPANHAFASPATSPLKVYPNVQRGNPMGAQTNQFQKPNLSVGQTITITSTQGRFKMLGSQVNGTASGTLTFTVTGKFARGYSLSLTGGSINVNGVTYTVSSGSAQMGLFANNIIGQGATSPTGQFLLQAQAHGDFSGTSSAVVSLDFTTGTTEYAVTLTGTIHG